MDQAISLRNNPGDAFYDMAQDEYPLSGTGACFRNNILTVLNKYYPDMFPGWSVVVDEDGGQVIIKNYLLSGRMGFRMHIKKMDPELRCIIRAGGELLERYAIARTKKLPNHRTMDLTLDYRGEARYHS